MSYISPQPEQSSPEEIELLTELNDLPNSSDNEFLKKVGGSIINSPIGSHINIGELGDVRIADVTTAGIDGTGHTISSVLLCRIKRVSATSDNYSGGVAIMDFDVHYEIDTMGSRQELVK